MVTEQFLLRIARFLMFDPYAISQPLDSRQIRKTVFTSVSFFPESRASQDGLREFFVLFKQRFFTLFPNGNHVMPFVVIAAKEPLEKPSASHLQEMLKFRPTEANFLEKKGRLSLFRLCFLSPFLVGASAGIADKMVAHWLEEQAATLPPYAHLFVLLEQKDRKLNTIDCDFLLRGEEKIREKFYASRKKSLDWSELEKHLAWCETHKNLRPDLDMRNTAGWKPLPIEEVLPTREVEPSHVAQSSQDSIVSSGFVGSESASSSSENRSSVSVSGSDSASKGVQK